MTHKGVLLVTNNIGNNTYIATIIKNALEQDYLVYTMSANDALSGMVLDTRIEMIIMFDSSSTDPIIEKKMFKICRRIVKISTDMISNIITVSTPKTYSVRNMIENTSDVAKLKDYLARWPISTKSKEGEYYLAIFNQHCQWYRYSESIVSHRSELQNYVMMLAAKSEKVVVSYMDEYATGAIPNKLINLVKSSDNVNIDIKTSMINLISGAKCVITDDSKVELTSILLNIPTISLSDNEHVPGVIKMTSITDILNVVKPQVNDSDIQAFLSKNRLQISGVFEDDVAKFKQLLLTYVKIMPDSGYTVDTDVRIQKEWYDRWKTFLHQTNCIPIQIPRNASNSITTFMIETLNSANEFPISTTKYPNLTAAQYLEEDREFFNSAYSFAILRNPLERLLSSFKYINSRNSFFNTTFGSIEELCHYIRNPRIRAIGDILRPQCEYVLDTSGKVLVTDLIPIEYLDRVWPSICNRYGVRPRLLPVSNSTGGLELMDHYDSESLKLASEIYQKDIDLYNKVVKDWQVRYAS